MLDFLLGLFGSGIDAISSHSQQKRQNAFNAQQAELNRDFTSQEAAKQRNWSTSEREATQEWNLEQWNIENEYNSPSAQLDRLLAAGINPNSAFQSMSNVSPGSVRTSAGSGAAASGSAASSAGLFNTNFGQAFQRYNESKLIDAQIKGQIEDTRGVKIVNDNQQRAFDDAHQEAQENINNLKKLGEKYGIEIDTATIERDISQENFNFIRDSAKTRLDQLKQELEKTKNEVKLGEEQLETEDLKQKDLQASIDLKNAEERKAAAQAAADEYANEIFFRTGIRPSDGTTAVFARAYDLMMQGHIGQAEHLFREYFGYLTGVRDASQFPTLDKVGVDILQPIMPHLKSSVKKDADFFFGTPTGSISNPTRK